MGHSTAAAIADMILDPSEDKRLAAIDALVAAPDDEYEAAMSAFRFAYPTAVALLIPLATLRRARKLCEAGS